MSENQGSRSPRWMQVVLIVAGVYNLVWGVVVVAWPRAAFDLAGLTPPTYPSIWQCVGMIVGVYGVGYLVAARDPYRHWPIVLVGLLGKVFGPIGFVMAATRGELPWAFGWTILTNDLIWWGPFAAMLWGAARAAQPTPAGDVGDPVRDLRGADGRTLAELSAGRTVLVVLLRHFGCTFCRETIHDLAQRRETLREHDVDPVVVHMSDDDAAAAFLDRYGLGDAARISDPERRLYRAFELHRGTLMQLLGPRVLWRGLVATLRGHVVGRLAGDGFQMPGTFLVRDGRIVRAHRHGHAGERLDLGAMLGDACETPLA